MLLYCHLACRLSPKTSLPYGTYILRTPGAQFRGFCKVSLSVYKIYRMWLYWNCKTQGGESRGFLQLFCTYIRAERVRKLFIIFLILNEFSCCKVENLCSDGISKCSYATRCIFIHKFEQRLSYVARTCVEKYTKLDNDSYDLLQKRQGICTLWHENSLSIKEKKMINFLTCSVRRYVQNVTWFFTVELRAPRIAVNYSIDSLTTKMQTTKFSSAIFKECIV